MYIKNQKDLDVYCNTHPEYAEEVRNEISLDFLAAHPESKYSTGQYGIAKVYVTDPLTGQTEQFAPTHAMIYIGEAYSLDVAQRYHDKYLKELNDAKSRKESTEMIEGLQDAVTRLEKYDFVTKVWMPMCISSSDITSPFYRKLFGPALTNDAFRNARNAKHYSTVFNVELISRYIKSPKGSRFTEDQVRNRNTEIFNELRDEMIETTGVHGLDIVKAAVLQQKVAVQLYRETGWEFSHREYKLNSINWDLIHLLEEAYPALSCIKGVVEDAYSADPEVRRAIESAHLNPVAKSVAYKRTQAQKLRTAAQILNFKEDEAPQTTEELFQYVISLATIFVESCNTQLDTAPSDAIIERDARQIAMVFIRMRYNT